MQGRVPSWRPGQWQCPALIRVLGEEWQAWWSFGLCGGGGKWQQGTDRAIQRVHLPCVKNGKSELINSSKGLEVLQNPNGIPSRRGNSWFPVRELAIPRHWDLCPSCDGIEEGWCTRRKEMGIPQLALVFPYLHWHNSLCGWRAINRSTWAVTAVGFRLGWSCVISLIAAPPLRLFCLGPVTSVRESTTECRNNRRNGSLISGPQVGILLPSLLI